ncbi:MAG: MFS-type transporter involved in bile tolerance (Atg22 family), partial [Halioglobus sp.]
MRTIEKFRFKSILLFFLLGIFVAVSVTPVQAQ